MASDKVKEGIEQANEILESATQAGVGSTLRYLRITKALAPLREVESHCDGDKDFALVKRRTVVIQCMAIASLCEDGLVRQDHAELLYRMEETLANWTWLYGRPEYHEGDCSTQFRNVFSEAITGGLGGPGKQDLAYKLEKFLKGIRRVCNDPFILALLAEVTHTILEEEFHQAVRLYESGKWAPAMSLLKSKDAELDAFVELEEKMENYPDENFLNWGLSGGFGRAIDLRTDYNVQLSVCQAAQLLHLGDLHFKDALDGEPEDLLAGTLLAQDDYRAALTLITGQDLELEGAILTRLARFYAEITKIPVTAHQLYLRAVQLATALQPALPKGKWYKESVDAVQAYRDTLEAEEAKKWEHARKPILEKLSGDMKKLEDAKNKVDAEFVKFIFETWPPKTEGGLEPPIDPENPTTLTKKQLLKAIQRYHTDKNSGWGDEWKVLSEEIAKALTARYNVMKGM